MAEQVVNPSQSTLQAFKNGNDGDLQVKNGRLYLNGPNTYTTLGTNTFAGEQVRGNQTIPLRECLNFSGTADLTLKNGNIYATGYGTVTLVY
jgi:hypothetical protein